MADPAGELECRHGAAELIGFGGRETGAHDRDLHRLLLEEWDAQRLLEDRFELGLGIFGHLLALAAAQIGMDHIALDGAGTDDRDLDHEIIKFLRLDPRQHRHLRPALDLEDAQRVGPLDHGIDGRIIVLKIGHADPDALMFLQQVEGAVHAAQHAEAQHVDLHEFERIDIILVPFDDLPVFHACGLDRDQIVETVLRQHETAGMLREMARCADELAGQFQR